MKPKRHIVLYIIALPWNLLVAWPVVLLIRLFWGQGLRWETPPSYDYYKGGGGGPCLSCQIRPGSWAVTPGIFPKGWYFNKRTNTPWGGTALGHAVFYGPNGRSDSKKWTETQAHEHIHVEQFEVSMLGSFIVGLAVGILLWALGHLFEGGLAFFCIWQAGYFMMGLSGWVTAWLRGEEMYHGSAHEESARAQDCKLSR